MDRMFFTRADRSNELTTTSINIVDIDAATLPLAEAAAASIETAFDGIVLADAHRIGLTVMVTETGKSLAGLRESKWLVKYRDVAIFKEFSVEIGTADPAAPTVVETNGKEILDPASTEYADVKAELEGFALSPYGNNIEVYEVELVGRNI